MKKYFYFLFAALCLSAGSVKASPGDTTWVQANANDSLDGYGNYDAPVAFPSNAKTYRKVYMVFTLGKHICAPGSQYCASWDYTVLNYLMDKQGDTLELGRFITPYATTGDPRTPDNFTYRYTFDVTDYYPLLKDSAMMRILYTGYSGGFTANIKFAFIEGVPERNVLGIQRLWTGSHGYGNATDPINNYYPAVSGTAPAGTQTTTLEFLVTGHGSDNNGCCEFMSHTYNVLLNNNVIDGATMWRPTCDVNELYPQTGTWPISRSNWCPGALVYAHYHDLPGITANSTYNADVQFEAYTSPNGGGSYTTEGSVFYYGGFNKTLDASIEDIIAPTDFEGHYRENPLCGTSTIHVKNSGSTTITSMAFQYGVVGGTLSNYTWQGSLASLHDTDVTLPENWQLRVVSGSTTTQNFIVNITQVNGQTGDDDTTNNVMRSTFKPSPLWPVTFVVSMKTNNEGVSGLNTGASETSWQIFDLNNNLVASRTDANVSQLYNDTVTLGPSCYKLVVTDLGEELGAGDGLNWWYWAAANTPVTSGTFTIKKTTNGASIPLSGNYYSGTYNNDFGGGFTQYFTTNWATGVEDVSNNPLSINAYPNPAQSNVTVSIGGLQDINGTVQMIDALGRVVMEQKCSNPKFSLNVSGLTNGLYTLVYANDNTPNNRIQTRIVVAK